LVDGIDLATVPGEQLHEQMGMVLQRNYLFQGTVEDSIRFGRQSATTSQILDALRQLDCMDLLESLPAGLDTQVGERGSNLSSGQRQLVCFARAMLTNPRILILDEATSSIDSQTERRLQAALRILLQGRTSVVVAHRLSTIRQADRILVVDKGRIVEQGQHMTLLAQGGPYARLHRQSVQTTPPYPSPVEAAAQSARRAPSRAA
jgi:ATP-binding cassette subfamily B protein